MKRSSLIASVAALVIVIVSALVMLPAVVRWSIVTAVERLGAEITLGQSDLSLGATITFEAENIAAKSSAGELQLSGLRVSLPFSAALPGNDLGLDKIELQGMQLTLKELPQLKSQPELETDNDEAPNFIQILDQLLVKFNHPAYRVKSVTLSDSVIRYHDDDQNIHLTLQEATFRRSSERSLLLAVNGNLNGYGLRLNTAIMRPNNLTEVSGSGQWQDYKLDIQGQLEQFVPMGDVNLSLSLTGSRAQPILTLIGAPELRDGSFSIRSQIQDQADWLRIETQTTLGAVTLESRGRYQWQQQNFDTEFVAKGPSLQEAGALFDIENYGQQAFEIDAHVEKLGSNLTLHRAEVTLGQGQFSAAGTLPEFPSTNNGALSLNADDFDLRFFQPLAPCELPNLQLDWQGQLATDQAGRENLALSATDDKELEVQLTGRLGDREDWSGTELHGTLRGLKSQHVTECTGFHFANDFSMAGDVTLEKDSTEWRLPRLSLSTPVSEVTGSWVSDKGELSISAPDAAALASLIPQFTLPLQSIPLTAELFIQREATGVSVNAPQIKLGSSQIQLNGEYRTNQNSELSLSFTGPDIREISADLPKSLATTELPFDLMFSAQLSTDQLVTANANLNLAENTLEVEINHALNPTSEETFFMLTGEGAALETLLGAFVAYDLPVAPYQFQFDLHHDSDRIKVQQLDLSVGEISLRGALDLDRWPNVAASHGEFQLSAPDVGRLLKLGGIQNQVGSASVDVFVQLDASREQIDVDLTKATFGATDLDGKISIRPGPTPSLEARLNSNHVALPTFFPSLVKANNDKKDEVKRNQYLIPQRDIPWHWLNVADVDFAWASSSIELKPGLSAAAKVAFTVTEGDLQSQALSWRSTNNQGSAALAATTSNSEPGAANVTFEITSDRIPALWFFVGTPTNEPSMNTRFRASLESQGATTHALRDNLTGHVLFRDGSGTFNSATLDTIFGDLLHQITSRVFGTGDKQTQVHCSAGAIQFIDGQAKFDPGIAVRTSRFDILTSGNILLPNEQLKLNLTSRSRKGIGVSAASTLIPKVGIAGSITQPKVQLNASETALTGGAAIATSGLTILGKGLWDRVRSSVENPCDAVIKRATEQGSAIYGSQLN